MGSPQKRSLYQLGERRDCPPYCGTALRVRRRDHALRWDERAGALSSGDGAWGELIGAGVRFTLIREIAEESYAWVSVISVLPSGPFRDYFYTRLCTELVFDGKRITVEGTSRCSRGDSFDSHGRRSGLSYFPPLYRCGPNWFGKRLADGSALMVGAYGVSRELNTPRSLPGPDMARHRERIAKAPRAVIWLNDAENPTRGEYYYSAIALEDPRSRLTEIHSEIVAVSTDYVSVSDPADEVPWVRGGKSPNSLTGRYANVVPKER